MLAELAPRPAADFAPLGPRPGTDAVLERIEAAGIVGMGGGGYPTARKIREAITGNADWVIGNGLASEPGVNADATLLGEHSAEITAGLAIVGRCIGASRTILAIPPDRVFESATSVDLAYPAGDERRLVEHLSERQVPTDGYPTDVGVLVLNVATLFAIHDAVVHGRSLRRRIVSVGATDYWVAIGTPFAELPLPPSEGNGYRVRGELTGRPVADDAIVETTTFSVGTALGPAWACIRCGWCESVCPEGLLPERLHTAFECNVPDATVFDCIECGACTAACPSRLDLVNEFRMVKDRMHREQTAKDRAEQARERSAARTHRLARRARQREQQRTERLRKPKQW